MSDDLSTHEVLADLRKVARGLALVFNSLVIQICTIVFGIIFLMIFVGQPQMTEIIALLTVGSYMFGLGMGVRGRSLCRAVPEGSDARTYIWGSVTIDLIFFTVCMAGRILDYPNLHLFLLSLVGDFISVVLFVVFLRHTAEMVQNFYLSSRAKAILANAGFICASLLCLLTAILSVDRQNNNRPNIAAGDVLVGCTCMTLMGMALVVFIQYANLLRNLSRAIYRMVDTANRYIGPPEESHDRYTR